MAWLHIPSMYRATEEFTTRKQQPDIKILRKTEDIARFIRKLDPALRRSSSTHNASDHGEPLVRSDLVR